MPMESSDYRHINVSRSNQKGMDEREFQNTIFAVQSSPGWSICSQTAATTLTTRTTCWTSESILAIPEGTVVHELCRKMNLVSRSSRCNKKWYVSVCKSVKKKEPLLKKKEDFTCLTFSEVEKNVLCDLLTCYLPGDGELAHETPHRNRNAKTAGGQKKHDNSFCNPSMKKDEIARKAEFSGLKID